MLSVTHTPNNIVDYVKALKVLLHWLVHIIDVRRIDEDVSNAASEPAQKHKHKCVHAMGGKQQMLGQASSSSAHTVI